MATVYINIGMQKTATTAIQYFMRENEENLKKQGCCYPYMDLGIPSKYKNRNAQFLVYRAEDIEEREEKKEAERQVREKAYEILAGLAQEYPKILLSDELIWHRSVKNANFWKRLIKNFKKIGCDVKIIVYLRRQDLFVQSIWNQSVKQLPRTSKTFQECISGKFFNYYPLDFYQQLSYIGSFVGKENLIVRVFERGQFEGEEHSVFSDFLNCMGLQMTEDFTKETVKSNLALEGNFIEIKRILNSVPGYAAGRDFIQKQIYRANCNQIETDPPPKMGMFSYEEQQEYLARFEESNRKAAEEFLGRENGVLFYEPIQELPKWDVQAEDMYRDLFACLTEVFAKYEEKIADDEQEISKNWQEIAKNRQEIAKNRQEISEIRKEIKELKAKVERMDRSLIFRGYRKAREVLKKT